jgi:hypothetical protein
VGGCVFAVEQQLPAGGFLRIGQGVVFRRASEAKEVRARRARSGFIELVVGVDVRLVVWV